MGRLKSYVALRTFAGIDPGKLGDRFLKRRNLLGQSRNHAPQIRQRQFVSRLRSSRSHPQCESQCG